MEGTKRVADSALATSKPQAAADSPTDIISKLPDELVLLIFNHFQFNEPYEYFPGRPNWRHRETLIALCQVNKECHRLATPVLYRSIYPTRGHGTDRMDKLLRTLLSKPELAAHIVMIDAYQMPFDEASSSELARSAARRRQAIPNEARVFRPRACMSALASSSSITRLSRRTSPRPTDPIGRTRAATSSTGHEADIEDEIGIRDCHLAPLRLLNDRDHLYSRIISCLRRGEQSAYLILLLTIAKNIGTIYLTFQHKPKNSIVTEFLSRLSSLAGADLEILPKFKTLGLYWWSNDAWDGALSLPDVRMLPRIPSLVTLCGEMVKINGREMKRKFGQELCNIRNIELEECQADATGIRQLLSCCPLLETLNISLGTGFRPPGAFESFNVQWQEIGDVLRERGHSLRCVKLELASTFHPEDRSEHPLGDLTSLSALEQLSAPVEALIGLNYSPHDDDGDDYTFYTPNVSRILPENLQYLEILGELDFLTDMKKFHEQLGMIMASNRVQRLGVHEDLDLEGFDQPGWQEREANEHDVVVFQKI